MDKLFEAVSSIYHGLAFVFVKTGMGRFDCQCASSESRAIRPIVASITVARVFRHQTTCVLLMRKIQPDSMNPGPKIPCTG
jgi:hypothetical protein